MVKKKKSQEEKICGKCRKWKRFLGTVRGDCLENLDSEDLQHQNSPCQFYPSRFEPKGEKDEVS